MAQKHEFTGLRIKLESATELLCNLSNKYFSILSIGRAVSASAELLVKTKSCRAINFFNRLNNGVNFFNALLTHVLLVLTL